MALGLAAQTPVNSGTGGGPSVLPYVEERNILQIFWRLDIFVGGGVQETDV